MNLSILYENRIIAVAKTEQGLAWLIEYGPVVADPPLPTWMLKALVADRRILRLRRGLFLAPTREGRLPSFPATINAVDPAGYITGHGALSIHGLNDQDVSHWWSITSRRRSDIRYGPYRAHFTLSPVQARQGHRTLLQVDGEAVTLATVTQAFVDEFRFMPYGLDWIETARVLRNALETQKTDEHEVVRLLGPRPSIAVARRAGLLFEMVRSEPNPELLSIARKNDDITRLAGATVTDKTWRLTLPFPRERILRAIR